jgi:bifunctional DNA-binding transcriptional regulator/antitoxin component of YhaV-PrlF toxin-antitoxin module
MSRISRKNQVTIPVDVLRDAGFKPGDDVHIHTLGRGRVEIERRRSWVDEFAGSMPEIGPSSEIDKLRDEWDR